jgi:hypothetical protein
MSGKVYRKRPERIYVTVTKEESDSIRAKAQAAGLSVAEFCRRVLKKEKITSTKESTELVWEVRRVASTLDQILQRMIILGITPGASLEQCIEDIEELKLIIEGRAKTNRGDSNGGNINVASNESDG